MPSSDTIARGVARSSDVAEAASVIERRGLQAPDTALILGSGLGELAEAEQATTVAAEELPGYPQPRVEGHRGRLVFGQLEGRNVVFVQGRVHGYEGYAPRRLAFPVRLVHALGARRLLVTNAAGGISVGLRPGSLMFITGHINFASAHPLAGGPGAGRAADRPPGVFRPVDPYDAAWADRAEQIALREGIATERGVYLWTQGPSYETKAEIQLFKRLGADAVGMSTVPEVLQAARLGMRVLGLSTITNPAAGLSDEPLDHDEVLETGTRVRARLSRLIRLIVRAC